MLRHFSDDWLKLFREIVEFDLEWCLSYLKAVEHILCSIALLVLKLRVTLLYIR